jgi:hypothetical protein
MSNSYYFVAPFNPRSTQIYERLQTALKLTAEQHNVAYPRTIDDAVNLVVKDANAYLKETGATQRINLELDKKPKQHALEYKPNLVPLNFETTELLYSPGQFTYIVPENVQSFIRAHLSKNTFELMEKSMAVIVDKTQDMNLTRDNMMKRHVTCSFDKCDTLANSDKVSQYLNYNLSELDTLDEDVIDTDNRYVIIGQIQHSQHVAVNSTFMVHAWPAASFETINSKEYVSLVNDQHANMSKIKKYIQKRLFKRMRMLFDACAWIKNKKRIIVRMYPDGMKKSLNALTDHPEYSTLEKEYSHIYVTVLTTLLSDPKYDKLRVHLCEPSARNADVFGNFKEWACNTDQEDLKCTYVEPQTELITPCIIDINSLSSILQVDDAVVIVNGWSNRSFIGNDGIKGQNPDSTLVCGSKEEFINTSYLHNLFYHPKFYNKENWTMV